MAGQQLTDFFTYREIKSFDEKTGLSTSHLVVHYKDLSTLVNQAVRSREITGSHIVKQGIGGGKRFLKFCINIVDVSSGDEAGNSQLQRKFRG